MDRATCSAVRTRPLRAGVDAFDPATLFQRLVPLEDEVDVVAPRPRRTRPLVALAAERRPVRSEPPLLVAAPGSSAWEVLGLSSPVSGQVVDADDVVDWAGQRDRRWGRRLTADPVWDELPDEEMGPAETPSRGSVQRWDDLPSWGDADPWGDADREEDDGSDGGANAARGWAVPPPSVIEAVFHRNARDAFLFDEVASP